MSASTVQTSPRLPTVVQGTGSHSDGGVARLQWLLQQYPKRLSHYEYGTAGFRYDATVLDAVMVRVGIMAVLYAAAAARPSNNSTISIGVMVTASHNDESYNGIKLADVDGGMLSPAGEALAISIVNEENIPKLLQQVATCFQNTTTTRPAAQQSNICIHVGRDTRRHSAPLCDLLVAAVTACGGATVINHGVVTTPALHFCTAHANFLHGTIPFLIPVSLNYAGYLSLAAQSYQTLLQTGTTRTPSSTSLSTTPPQQLVIDCACGVGYPALQLLMQSLQERGVDTSRFVLCNGPTDGPLNEQAGSEHVQKALQPPVWYSGTPTSLSYCASLDGDADRIVFFSVDGSKRLILQDGDKMACLICQFLQQQFKTIQAAVITTDEALSRIRLGVVQTAYANGASTAYLRNVCGVEPILAKTGVKFVHAAAHEHADVGIYFEANGHGTVLFGQAFYEYIAQAEKQLRLVNNNGTANAMLALQRLRVLPSLVNQCVGDALSDLLLMDAILQLQQMSLQEWNELYTDLPSRQCKVYVADRSVLITNETETACLQPLILQMELDKAMSQYPNGRAFVRPSGTEDVVRVYAEAATREHADALATAAAAIVHEHAGGLPDQPPPTFGTALSSSATLSATHSRM